MFGAVRRQALRRAGQGRWAPSVAAASLGAGAAGFAAALHGSAAAAAAAPEPPLAAVIETLEAKLAKLEAAAAAGAVSGCDDAASAIAAAREVGRKQMWPAIEPFNSGYLSVPTATSVTHEIYYEECGNPTGKPVVVIHGGPGGGGNTSLRSFHDPAVYRIINFDQRGCGRSKPHAELTENTTCPLPPLPRLPPSPGERPPLPAAPGPCLGP